MLPISQDHRGAVHAEVRTNLPGLQEVPDVVNEADGATMAWEGDDPVPVHEEGVHWPPVQDVKILMQASHAAPLK